MTTPFDFVNSMTAAASQNVLIGISMVITQGSGTTAELGTAGYVNGLVTATTNADGTYTAFRAAI